MKHRRPPLPLIVILVLAILVGGYYGILALLDKENGALTASGTIEAVEVSIAPEIGGKVVEVLVDEGDRVKKGDKLFRLDDTLLQAQRAVAAASLELSKAAASTAEYARWTAEDNYNLVLNAARLDSAAARTSDWRATNPVDYALPGGYFSHNEQMVAAQAEVEAARSARDAAQSRLNDLRGDTVNADFFSVETRLENARAAILVAQDVLTRANLSANTDLRDSAQAAFDSAETGLEDAQSAYDALSETDNAKAIITARAGLAAAQERYESAQDRLLALQIGVYSPKVTAAQAVLNQAVAAAGQAQMAVAQAEASLALIEAQIEKLTITAPDDGTLLTRSIEVGEVVPVGAIAMTLGRLEDLTITVFIPEERYGEIRLGQSVSVSVDSFPDETFTARVSHIADQAEFTPRNVQTVEGRKSTVFAIRLQVEDPGGKLKPGMPADVKFTP